VKRVERFHPRRVWGALSDRETSFVADALRQETIGGAILLVTATVAVVWANSPWRDSYDEFLHFEVGPLSVEHWAADGGLALFFYIAGLELKRELTVGSLSRPADALVPVSAAVAGMLVPACVYLVVNVNGSPEGWAVPMATDIAFALAVLAVVGRALPPALRAFLLTLAVVDDLGSILVIATVYTTGLDFLALGGAAVLLVVYWLLQQRRVSTWLIYVPLAVATWWLVYLSGVHATIAGVALGLLTRCVPDEDEDESPAERVEHRLRPLSAGVAVPFFALVSAGVSIDLGTQLWREPVVVGIVLGLVVGKSVGVVGGAWLVTRLTRAELADGVYWRDVVGVATVSGVGFTVSLLIAELAFGGEEVAMAKTAVLAGSLVAGLLAAAILYRRHKHHESHQAA
jgi:NhaA family Na+:H+ antiporter